MITEHEYPTEAWLTVQTNIESITNAVAAEAFSERRAVDYEHTASELRRTSQARRKQTVQSAIGVLVAASESGSLPPRALLEGALALEPYNGWRLDHVDAQATLASFDTLQPGQPVIAYSSYYYNNEQQPQTGIITADPSVVIKQSNDGDISGKISLPLTTFSLETKRKRTGVNEAEIIHLTGFMVGQTAIQALVDATDYKTGSGNDVQRSFIDNSSSLQGLKNHAAILVNLGIMIDTTTLDEQLERAEKVHVGQAHMSRLRQQSHRQREFDRRHGRGRAK